MRRVLSECSSPLTHTDTPCITTLSGTHNGNTIIRWPRSSPAPFLHHPSHFAEPLVFITGNVIWTLIVQIIFGVSPSSLHTANHIPRVAQ